MVTKNNHIIFLRLQQVTQTRAQVSLIPIGDTWGICLPTYDLPEGISIDAAAVLSSLKLLITYPFELTGSLAIERMAGAVCCSPNV